MITWHSPLAFLLFIALALVVVWAVYQQKRLRPTLQYSSLSRLKKIRPTLKSRLVVLPMVLRCLGLACAILALARPQRVDTQIKRNVEGIDIMLVLDISDSMLIEDMQPENRLESSKMVFKNFVQGRVSDRMGLIIFSGESFTRVPLTLDYPLLLKSIDEIEITRNIKMGTAIGVALANAVGRLKDSTAKSRVIIFCTDGENNSGTIDPETAIEIAKGYGIKVYSIGMGRDGESQLPVYIEDGLGRKVKRYRPIHSDINVELLQRMASETGGKFWRATETDALKAAFSEINRLEKTKIEVNQYTKYTELYPPFLKAGLLLYVLSFVLGRTWLRRTP